MADGRSPGHSALSWLLGAILATRHLLLGLHVAWLLGHLLVLGAPDWLAGHLALSWSLGGHSLLFWLLNAFVAGRRPLICSVPFWLFGAILAFRSHESSAFFGFWCPTSHLISNGCLAPFSLLSVLAVWRPIGSYISSWLLVTLLAPGTLLAAWRLFVSCRASCH